MMVIDANIFLEAALERKRGRSCRRFLESVRDGVIKAAVTDFHIDTILVVLETHGMGWPEISNFLASLFRSKGLTVHSPGLVGRLRAAKVMRDEGIDFDDALIVQTVRDLSGGIVVSYDRHFDSVEGVERRIPEDLLG
jgi:predicted nucleic acid-binding protein